MSTTLNAEKVMAWRQRAENTLKATEDPRLRDWLAQRCPLMCDYVIALSDALLEHLKTERL